MHLEAMRNFNSYTYKKYLLKLKPRYYALFPTTTTTKNNTRTRAHTHTNKTNKTITKKQNQTLKEF